MGLNMRKIALSLAVLVAILAPALHTAPAHAANVHSWVSHNGSDVNPCTLISPCATFSRALTQTSDTGEITCLDSGNFDVFTVTIQVVIDCRGTVPTNLVADNTVRCLSAAVINAPGKVVTLRGLNLINLGLCNNIDGIVIQAAAAVYIEDCVIEN
jgi:hypothetical protein